MTITEVTFSVQLDTEAVQAHLSLLGWAALLDIDTPEPTWDHIYRELGKMLVGAPHYQRFCRTARSDLERFSSLKLYDKVETKTPATPGFEVPKQESKVAVPKVVTPPTPPRKAKA